MQRSCWPKGASPHAVFVRLQTLLIASLLSPGLALAQGGGDLEEVARPGPVQQAAAREPSAHGERVPALPARRLGGQEQRVTLRVEVTGGRIDGTVTPGPAMQGDDVIRRENSRDSSKADRKIDSICKGC